MKKSYCDMCGREVSKGEQVDDCCWFLSEFHFEPKDHDPFLVRIVLEEREELADDPDVCLQCVAERLKKEIEAMQKHGPTKEKAPPKEGAK